jgi:glycosyltransferase involved in cell wall biosynthesis
MFFSIVIPLYNRPQEIKELLTSLLKQTYTLFEVVIVEDGSSKPAEHIVQSFANRLDIQYLEKKNEGQGFARNYGFERAKGDFFIVFDSDIIVPSGYLELVKKSIEENTWDAFGGPDASHESFTTIQKAISYSMTSPFTTGGIRGNKKHVGQFHPRSFNMGISKALWANIGGYKLSRRSEDIEFSIRMINSGYKVGLIPEAFVYHKRRTSFSQFFKQTNAFGKGRIDVSILYPSELKLVHALPAAFTLGVIVLLVLNIINYTIFTAFKPLQILVYLGNTFIVLYTCLLFLHALFTTKSISVAFKGVIAAFTQLFAYGTGFMTNYIDRIWLHKNTSK